MNTEIKNFEERILFILKLIYRNGSQFFEYRISKMDEFIETLIQNHAEKVYLVDSRGEHEICVYNGKIFRLRAESTEFVAKQ